MSDLYKDLLEEGYYALQRNNRIAKEEVYQKMKIIMKEEDVFAANNTVINSYLSSIPMKISDLSDYDLQNNLISYCNYLSNKIKYQEQLFNSYQEMIARREQSFSRNQVIYSDNQNSLKVTDILDITGTVLDVASMFDVKTENYKRGVLFLKGLNKTFNNEPRENNISDNLSYGVDLLSEVLKCETDNTNAKKTITACSTGINLLIKFLSK